MYNKHMLWFPIVLSLQRQDNNEASFPNECSWCS